MTAEKIANLIHMVELQHRKPDFHKTLEEHKLTVSDWQEMLGVLQDWYAELRAKEGTPQKKVSLDLKNRLRLTVVAKVENALSTEIKGEEHGKR